MSCASLCAARCVGCCALFLLHALCREMLCTTRELPGRHTHSKPATPTRALSGQDGRLRSGAERWAPPASIILILKPQLASARAVSSRRGGRLHATSHQLLLLAFDAPLHPPLPTHDSCAKHYAKLRSKIMIIPRHLVAQTWSNSGQTWSSSGQCGGSRANFRRFRRTYGRMWLIPTDFGRYKANPGRIGRSNPIWSTPCGLRTKTCARMA